MIMRFGEAGHILTSWFRRWESPLNYALAEQLLSNRNGGRLSLASNDAPPHRTSCAPYTDAETSTLRAQDPGGSGEKLEGDPLESSGSAIDQQITRSVTLVFEELRELGLTQHQRDDAVDPDQKNSGGERVTPGSRSSADASHPQMVGQEVIYEKAAPETEPSQTSTSASSLALLVELCVGKASAVLSGSTYFVDGQVGLDPPNEIKIASPGKDPDVEKLALLPSATEGFILDPQQLLSSTPISNFPLGAFNLGLSEGRVYRVESFLQPGMTDDVAVQAAIDAAAVEGGGTVLFAARDYVFANTVHLKSGVDMDGNGAVIRWPSTSSAYSFFRADTIANVDIYGFTFAWSGGRLPSSTVQTHAVVIENSKRVTVAENLFRDSKAIHVVGAEDVLIWRNDILRGAEGVVVGGLTTDEVNPAPLSRNILIVDNYMQGQRREAIDVNSNAMGVQIVRNTLLGGDPGRASMVHVDEIVDIGGGSITDVVIANNIIDGLNTYSSAIRAKLGIKNLNISNNTIAGLVSYSGIAAINIQDTDQFDIQNNWISAPSTSVMLLGRTSGLLAGNRFDSLLNAHILSVGANSKFTDGGNQLTRSTFALQTPGVGELPGERDVLAGRPWAETMTGTSRGDVLDGDAGADVLFGKNGDDTLLGITGNDRLHGGPGSDHLFGGAGADTLIGDDGNDWILDDGQDNDSLDGGSGDDTISAGAGHDRLLGGDGQDSLIGGNGNDTIFGGANADTLMGDEGNDLLDGGEGEDIVRGMSGNDTLRGSGGSDLLLGEGGADFIEGGDGADTLDGGAGADTLFGGSGQDLFVYAQHSLSGIDVIADFQPGEDKISLKAIDADTTKVGDQDFDFLGTAVFFGTFPGVRFWHDDHATNVELTIVGEAQPTSLLRLLGHHTLSASDFV